METTVAKSVGAKSTIGTPSKGGEFAVYYDPTNPDEALRTIVVAYRLHCVALGLHMGTYVATPDNKVITTKDMTPVEVK